MLHRADSRFKTNVKDNNILKLKVWHDAEARVLHWGPTESGKHETMYCKDLAPDSRGEVFHFCYPRNCGVSEGTIITYQYLGRQLKSFRPEAPRFLRVYEEV